MARHVGRVAMQVNGAAGRGAGGRLGASQGVAGGGGGRRLEGAGGGRWVMVGVGSVSPRAALGEPAPGRWGRGGRTDQLFGPRSSLLVFCVSPYSYVMRPRASDRTLPGPSTQKCSIPQRLREHGARTPSRIPISGRVPDGAYTLTGPRRVVVRWSGCWSESWSEPCTLMGAVGTQPCKPLNLLVVEECPVGAPRTHHRGVGETLGGPGGALGELPMNPPASRPGARP